MITPEKDVFLVPSSGIAPWIDHFPAASSLGKKNAINQALRKAGISGISQFESLKLVRDEERADGVKTRWYSLFSEDSLSHTSIASPQDLIPLTFKTEIEYSQGRVLANLLKLEAMGAKQFDGLLKTAVVKFPLIGKILSGTDLTPTELETLGHPTESEWLNTVQKRILLTQMTREEVAASVLARNYLTQLAQDPYAAPDLKAANEEVAKAVASGCLKRALQVLVPAAPH
jgi:hypothetical protein